MCAEHGEGGNAHCIAFPAHFCVAISLKPTKKILVNSINSQYMLLGTSPHRYRKNLELGGKFSLIPSEDKS